MLYRIMLGELKIDMKKRPETPAKAGLPPVCQRIAWLLVHAWGNSVTRMAKSLGVSQPALSRVLAGQLPSGKMVQALAGRADINSRWLLTGQGTEMAEPGRSAGSVLCPLATALLPGDPAARPELLAGLTLPVASPHLLGAPYWFEVQGGDPVTKDRREQIAGGDYLLIETSSRWTARPEAYLGRVVVLCAEGRPPLLARVEKNEAYFAEDGRHELNTFGVIPDAALVPKSRPEAVKSGPGDSGGTELFYGDDVVGVVLQVARMM
jgi:hypothetical protein